MKAATKFLNLANGEPSRETGYLLFATVLEMLSDEEGQPGVGKVVAQCRKENERTYDENEGRELYRIRNKLVHEGNPRLDRRLLSWDEFSERYWRIRELAGQAVLLKLNELLKYAFLLSRSGWVGRSHPLSPASIPFCWNNESHFINKSWNLVRDQGRMGL